MAFAYNLAPGAIQYTHSTGKKLAFGFYVDGMTVSLRGYKEVSPGQWDYLRNPANDKQTSLYWSLYHGPFAGAGSYDNDGPLDPNAEESIDIVSAANKYGIEAMISEYIDDQNDLADAELGHMPTGPVVPPDEPFRDSTKAKDAIVGALANYQAVGGKLVRKV